MATDESLGDLTEELRLLIIASRGIFDYFAGESYLNLDRMHELGIPLLTMRSHGDVRWHCSSWPPLRFSILYQYLIPHFHNMTADEQFEFVDRYHFIPWSAQTVQAIKEKYSATACDLKYLNDLNRVNLIVDAEQNTLESFMNLN